MCAKVTFLIYNIYTFRRRVTLCGFLAVFKAVLEDKRLWFWL